MSDLDELDPVLAGAVQTLLTLCSLLIVVSLVMAHHEQSTRPACSPIADPAIIKQRVCAP